MKRLFSIGEVSKIKDITIKALRYYHKVGILIPNYVDEITGYRYYSIDQFIHIDIIKGCRELGTSINELEIIFKSADTEELIKFLNFKKEEARDNISKMELIIEDIEDINLLVKNSKEILDKKDIYIELMPKRYIIVAPFPKSEDLNELIYYSELEKLIKKNNIKASKQTGTITNLDIDGNMLSRYVFREIKSANKLSKESVIALPEGKYLMTSYTKETEDECKIKIKNYMKENGLNPKLFIEIDLLDKIFNTDSYSCQVQIFI